MAIELPTCRVVGALLFGLTFLISESTSAQSYPTKPIRITVTASPGSLADTVARILSQPLEHILHQPVSVESRPGSATVKAISRERPDGYLLLLLSDPAVAPLRLEESFKPAEELTPIAFLGAVHYGLAVQGNAPYTNIADFVLASKQKESGVATPGDPWTNSVLQQFTSITKIRSVSIPYRGSSPAMADLLGGKVQAAVLPVALASEHIKRGNLRLLAIFGNKRLGALQNVPTAREQGVSLVAFAGYGLVAPRGLPQIERTILERAIAKSLADDGVRKRLEQVGFDALFGPATAYRTYLAAAGVTSSYGGGTYLMLSCTKCSSDSCNPPEESCKICCESP